MKYQYPITATNRGGESRTFYDADALWSFIRDPNVGRVGGYWLETYYGLTGNHKLTRLHSTDTLAWWRNSYENDWILRDDRGSVVDKNQVPAPPRPARGWSLRYEKRQEDKRRAAERGDPIPGTGKGRRYWRRSKSWTKNGRNGAHNQRKGIKLYEDPRIERGDFDDL